MNTSKLMLWSFYALLFGGPRLLEGQRTGLPLGIVLGLCWLLITPLLSSVARRRPFSRTDWLIPALTHVPVFVLCCMMTAIIAAIVTALSQMSSAIDLDAIIDQAIAATMPLYVGVVAATVILDAHTRVANLERDAAQTQLRALRAQLNPHFLFNALNTVAMAVRRADRREALAVVADLSTLLRGVLRTSNTELIRLDEEIEFIDGYLDIEKIRFRTQVEASWHVDDRAHNAAVPAMIMQPLVENALRHGVGRRKEACRMNFRVTVDDGMLSIAVEDDGVGFSEDWREGVGLSNVRNRLALHFSDKGRLQIDREHPGASVRISMPFRELSTNAEIQNPDRR
jgi:two-component system, LytTR family, sensor kinase